MIEFRNVALSFDRRPVLDGISFAARFYEKIAIIGRSGEGKTTVLRLLLGLMQPDRGAILINGQDITKLSETGLRKPRMNFSIVFQEGALFDSLSVRDNVAFALRECSQLDETGIEKVVRELLGRVGIEEAIDLMPEELSGGMQRRVAIARSLAACTYPKMMLYDEPTTGIDPIAAENICSLISELSSGSAPDRRGLIIVTHEVAYAAHVAERFLYLKNGKIEFDGSLDALKETSNAELRRFIREILPEYRRI
jgi:phospholipid/cholesterol/gamma-HCH transport system ATP-binding protein